MKRLALGASSLLIVTAIVFLSCRADSAPLPRKAKADLILVEKEKRALTLFADGRPLKSYRISLGPNPAGHKLEEGDGKTPEGRYVIDFHKRDSSYHRALHISYPNAADRAQARRRGVSPGGDIMIHGLPNGLDAVGSTHVATDWTLGCIAVTNEEIEEIWRAVADGTPIEIRP